jgi:Ca2+-binding EF-hand superfamily protein
MNVRNRGRDLFEILDVDRNRSLGRRELAQAVKRVELWDTDEDGVISESEVPQLYQISFGPGQP